MSLIKKYLQSREKCEVVFRIQDEEISPASKVWVVGSFNHWDREATPMTRDKDGYFKCSLDLKTGKAYRFRYLVDKRYWLTDDAADSREITPFGKGENSVIYI